MKHLLVTAFFHYLIGCRFAKIRDFFYLSLLCRLGTASAFVRYAPKLHTYRAAVCNQGRAAGCAIVYCVDLATTSQMHLYHIF